MNNVVQTSKATIIKKKRPGRLFVVKRRLEELPAFLDKDPRDMTPAEVTAALKYLEHCASNRPVLSLTRRTAN